MCFMGSPAHSASGRTRRMAETVYLLCALTSFACALVLVRGHRRTRSAVLFWSGVCFIGLALNNILLFTDLVILPSIDLSLVRTIPAALGILALLCALIWESH